MKNALKNFKLSSINRYAGILIAAAIMTFAFQSCSKESIDPTATASYKVLNANMRKLWSDHMQWTYSTVDAFFNNPDGLNGPLNRLLQNQKDIGAAIIPYYGEDAGGQLTKLLTDHITGAVPVLTAAKEGNNEALTTALNDWYKNAQDIADFLANANPNWKQEDMRHMMKTHIDQTTEYAVDLLQKDYNKAIKVFDEANEHMLMMADDLSEGIAKQFPEKF
ncbi:MAG: glycosyltransferase [Saprospiraceae bacterium]|nr:glycosyltransferase [Candidatus Parvibacillus calidus]